MLLVRLETLRMKHNLTTRIHVYLNFKPEAALKRREEQRGGNHVGRQRKENTPQEVWGR